MKSKIRVRCMAAHVLTALFLVSASASGMLAQPSATEALFDLNSTAKSPFPSDWFTAPDNTNKTHLRINLPLPNCETYVSDCEDIAVLNEFDGFNLMPLMSIPFNGPIDPNTVTSESVFLVSLGTAGFGEDYMPWGTLIGINQVVWDPDADILHVESDQVLAQHTRFALIVTRKVLDGDGAPVAAAQEFRQFRGVLRDDYKQALLEAIEAARQAGVREQDIAVASVFTTRSATAIMEKIRDQIHGATPDPANFLLGPEGYRTVFSLNQVNGITWYQQTAVGSTPTPVPLNGLASILNGNVGTIAFGKYVSRDYLVHNTQYIPAVGTRSGAPEVQGAPDTYFNLYLPSGNKPLNGWPVAIYVHGINGSKEVSPLAVVNSMAKHGIATIAINDVGHGFGPGSTLSVSLNDAADPVTFKAGGRGIDQNGDGKFDNAEGLQSARPRGVVFFSDAYRQTAADLMQLVRVIEVGLDVDGDGRPDVDASRIYLLTHSLGGGIGTVFFAVEPDVRVGVLDVPFDPIPAGMLSCGYRPAAGLLIMSRTPSLLNPTGAPRINALDGCAVGTPRFDENFPLRDGIPLTVGLTTGGTAIIQSPVSNTVAGAMAILKRFENYRWVGQAGSPLAYAPHLLNAPLAGVPPKSMLLLTAQGDQTAPNPTTTAIVRAGDLADRTLYYRHDLYRAAHPTLTANPHGFAIDASFGEISQGVQEMIGEFFQSDGSTFATPEPSEYFELPIVLPLPEGLNYLH